MIADLGMGRSCGSSCSTPAKLLLLLELLPKLPEPARCSCWVDLKRGGHWWLSGLVSLLLVLMAGVSG